MQKDSELGKLEIGDKVKLDEEEDNNENLNSVNLARVYKKRTLSLKELDNTGSEQLPLSSVINQIKNNINSNIVHKVIYHNNDDTDHKQDSLIVDNGHCEVNNTAIELENINQVKHCLDTTSPQLKSNKNCK